MTRLSTLFLCGILALAGCTNLPSSGPDTGTTNLVAVNKPEGVAHAVVNVTPEILKIVDGGRSSEGLGQLRGGGGAAPTRIGVGDIVSVTIFEASAGGLFIPAESTSRAGNYVTLPDQQVDSSGNISVPYAGTIRVLGIEPAEIERIIQQRLASRAIEPQAVISIKQQNSSQVSVIGEVNAPAKFQLNAKGERVLDAIARAGGPKQQGYDTYVTLQRGTKKVTVYFQTLIREPSNNIYLSPGDTIYVFSEPHTFLAFGAAGQNGRFNFENESISVADALGKAGGLLDSRANPGAVLLYRVESRKTARRLGVKVEDVPGDDVPIIYQFDLREESGFFLASNFPMRNKDVIFIGNAAAVQFLKGVDVIGSVAAAASATRAATR
jgi:polysaccharide export outer membrane protein